MGQTFGGTYTFRLCPKRILVTSDFKLALTAFKNRPGGFRRLSTIGFTVDATTTLVSTA